MLTTDNDFTFVIHFQIIELAWFLTENDVSVVSLVRAFTFMKSCLRSCRVTEAICGMSRIAEAFSTSFEVNVSHSFFDFIQVSIFLLCC